MIAIDTNLLIYAHRAGIPEHRSARKALEKACANHAGWGFSVSCLTEFWSIVTHPACAGRPSTPKEARRFIHTLIEDGGALVWVPGVGFEQRLMGKAAELKVSGIRIFDLQIGLIAFENGAHTIWTHDKDFLKLPGLNIEDPLTN